MPHAKSTDGELHYEIADLTPPWIEEPETILFHHGIGIDKDIWADWVPILAGEFRVVRFDTRGFGQSHVPGPGYDWSMDLLMSDVLAVAEAVGAEKFHLVGESLGGTVTLYTAIHHGERLLSATALSTGHKGGNIQNVRDWRDFVAEKGYPAWSDLMIKRRFFPGAVTEDAYDWFARVQGECPPESTLELAELLIKQDISNELAKIAVPVLLLHPDSSPFLPVSMTSEIHGLLEDSEMHVIPHARHGIAFSHAAECAMTLLDFIDRNRA
jgi:pimeloyl-ACP methyl ester carboxylesterase